MAALLQAGETPRGRSSGASDNWFRTWGFPLILLLVSPPTAVFLWLITVYYDGSIFRFLQEAGFDDVVRRLPAPSWTALGIFAVWATLQWVLLRVLPGKKHLGPFTPMGNRPEYKLNGVLAFFVTCSLWYLGAYQLHLFSPTIVYDHFGSLLVTLSAFALAMCAVLYLKGIYWPSSSDNSHDGNVIWNYYWGVELHPTLFGASLKQWFNCRISMMGWCIILLSFVAKQHELYGKVSNAMIVSVLLQLAYVLKFFVWEGGYFNSLDIMHDHFGFYIGWGVTAWLPAVYTLVGLYIVAHPVDMPMRLAVLTTALGLGSIWLNYNADAQRQRVRSTNGKATVWGNVPEVIRAQYETADGCQHPSLLLVSGWWGVSRHFHYIPEILLSLAWTIPAGFTNAIPYFYVLYLTILLVDRSGRDEARCAEKYGKYWVQYCERVRYKIVPFVY